MLHVCVQKLSQGKSLEIKYFVDVGVVFYVFFCRQASDFLHLMQLIENTNCLDKWCSEWLYELKLRYSGQ